jgi:hypothetical protein
MRLRALVLAILTLNGCASSESVWRAREPKHSPRAKIAGRLCACPPKEGAAYLGTLEAQPGPPLIRRHIFGDFFLEETIDKLEVHYGTPLETTLDPLLAEFEPDDASLVKVKSTLVERLPLALASATAALIAPSAGVLRELRRIRAEYDDAKADGDAVTVKTKRAELWRAYRAGLDTLHEVAMSILIDALTHRYDFDQRASRYLYERVASEAGIAEYASADVLQAAGSQHARRRAVVIVAGVKLGALVEIHRPSLATYVMFP